MHDDVCEFCKVARACHDAAARPGHAAGRLDAPGVARKADRVEQARTKIVKQRLSRRALDDRRAEHRRHGVVAMHHAAFVLRFGVEKAADPVEILRAVVGLVIEQRTHPKHVANRRFRGIGMRMRRCLVGEIVDHAVVQTNFAFACKQPDADGDERFADGIQPMQFGRFHRRPVGFESDFSVSDQKKRVQTYALAFERAKIGDQRGAGDTGLLRRADGERVFFHSASLK